MARLHRDAEFRRLIGPATLFVADGMPLVWASRLQGTPLPERVPGSNLISILSHGAAGRGRSVFLLGGDEGTAEGAADVLLSRDPDLRIAGTLYPPMGFENDPEEMGRIRDTLADSSPDIVYVALGSPKQERLIRGIRDLLPGAWWVGVGISFSFLTADVRRAPTWMQRVGLEWVHRLAQEPGRLARRYLLHDIPFALVLFGDALCRRCFARR